MGPIHPNPYRDRDELAKKVEARGINISRHLSNTALAKCIWKHDEKVMIYEECTVGALRQFATQRGLAKAPEIQHLPRRKVIIILEEADHNPNFSLLANLPPELRLEIYEWYFVGLRKENGEERGRNPAHQPLLLRTCRWLRKEARPIFLNGCKLSLHLESTCWPEFEAGDVKISDTTGRGLKAISFRKLCDLFDKYAGSVSELHIYLHDDIYGYSVTLIVPMRKGRPEKLDMIEAKHPTYTSYRYPETDRGKIEDAPKKALKALSAKPVNEKLKLADFEGVRKAFQDHLKLLVWDE